MKELSREVGNLNNTYKVLVENKEIEQGMVEKLQDLGKRVKIPGFRIGHVPLPILMKNYGDVVRRDVVVDVVKKVVDKFVQEEKLHVAFKPLIEVVEHTADGVVVNVSVDLVPKIELVDFGKPTIKKYSVKITEERIDELIENLRKNSPLWIEKEDGAVAEDGDKVIADVETTGPKKKDRRKMENVPFVIDNNADLNKVVNTDVFKNAKVGDVVEVTFDAVDHAAKAKIKAIYRAQQRELDDEFAKLIGLESKDKIREWAEGVLKSEFKQEENDLVKKQLLDLMSNMYSFDVPRNMVNLEMKEIEKQLLVETRNSKKRIKDDKKDEVRAKCEDIAIRRVRLGLVVAKLANDNNIHVDQDELRRAVFSIARMYPGQEREVIRKYYNDQGLISAVAGPLLEDKVVNFILDKYASVENIEVNKDELEKVSDDAFDFFNEDYLEDLPQEEESKE